MSRSWRRSSTEAVVAARRRLPLALALALCALPVVAAPSAGGELTPAALGERARSLLADPRYQREFPLRGNDAGAGPGADSRRGELGEPGSNGGLDEPGEGRGARPGAPGLPQGGRAPRRAMPPPVLPTSDAAHLARLVLYVLAGAAFLLLALWALRLVWERRRPAAPAAAGPPPAGGQPAEAPPGDAGRLPADERYGEAVHALLLDAIRQLAARFRIAIPSSRTSREILGLLPLQAGRRDAFAELVRTVERSLFGGAPLGRDDYERSLAQVRLVLGVDWSPARKPSRLGGGGGAA